MLADLRAAWKRMFEAGRRCLNRSCIVAWHLALVMCIMALCSFCSCGEWITLSGADGGNASKKAKLQHRGTKQPKAVVLDIEGTVAPISFVKETLFPYARARVAEHLTRTFESAETQADLDQLRQQVMSRFADLEYLQQAEATSPAFCWDMLHGHRVHQYIAKTLLLCSCEEQRMRSLVQGLLSDCRMRDSVSQSLHSTMCWNDMMGCALAQAQDDAAPGTSVVTIPDATAGKDVIVDAATRNVFAQMDTDRKTTALKSLQVCSQRL